MDAYTELMPLDNKLHTARRRGAEDSRGCMKRDDRAAESLVKKDGDVVVSVLVVVFSVIGGPLGHAMISMTATSTRLSTSSQSVAKPELPTVV
jgi:hypothetical protein